MKKFIIALATVFVLCVPAFADDETYFVSLPFSLTNASETNTVTVSNITGVSYAYLQNTGGGIVSLNVLSEDPSAITSFYKSENDTYINSSTYVAFGDYYRYVYGVNQFFTGYSTSIPITAFPSSATSSDVLSEFSLFLENQPTPAPSGNPVTVHVPYGNVLYIKVDQRQEDIKLVAHMPKLSFLIPDRNYGYWGETGICWGDYNTLPYSGLTFPLNGMSGIDWQRDSSRNILGQTKTGVATKIMNTGVWYALFCPSLFGHFDLDSSSALPGASVDVTGVFSDIRLYPLSDSYSFVDNEVINGSDSEYQDYLDGESTESGTVTWTDQDGNVSAPRAGGSSYVPEAETADSLVSQIKNILGNIVKELQTLFTFGYDAIQTLVNLMSDFVSGFSQLYTWLPAPVYSVIISAVTIAIVIGVFKVFL